MSCYQTIKPKHNIQALQISFYNCCFLLALASVSAQTITIKGKVLSNDNQVPLEGAAINIKGSARKTALTKSKLSLSIHCKRALSLY